MGARFYRITLNIEIRTSYPFLGIVHQALIQLGELSICDISISLLYILKVGIRKNETLFESLV